MVLENELPHVFLVVSFVFNQLHLSFLLELLERELRRLKCEVAVVGGLLDVIEELIQKLKPIGTPLQISWVNAFEGFDRPCFRPEMLFYPLLSIVYDIGVLKLFCWRNSLDHGLGVVLIDSKVAFRPFKGG